MKCNKCNAEWNVDASRSASITVCPFCQAEIARDKSDWQFFDNTKELLAFIAAEYGSDALFARKYFSDHTSPMMPQGQKNLVKQAFECGAVKVLQGNVSSDPAHKEIAVKQAAQKLIDTYSSAREAAERVVWEFTNALGWGLPEPAGSAPPPQPQQQRPTYTAQTAAPGIGALMTRAWQFAEDGDWKEAADYFNKVLDSDPSYAPAFLGLLCVDLKASKEDKLANAGKPTDITTHKYYKRVIVDSAIKAQLDGYIQTIQARIAAEQKAAAAEAERKRKAAEEAARRKRVQDAFDDACKIMNSAQNPEDYRKAITAFSSIDSNYRDINSQIKVKVDEYERKMKQMLAELDRVLAPLREKYDPKTKAAKQAKLHEQREEDRKRLDEENARAKAGFEAKRAQIKEKYAADHKAWQDEYNRLKSAYDAENKKWEAEATAIKSQAEQWKSQGLCPHCGGTLKGLLTKKCTECGKNPGDTAKIPIVPTQPNYPLEPRQPQMATFVPKVLDESKYTLREAATFVINQRITLAGIEWRILDVRDGKLLLISEEILEKRPYNVEQKDITWENCTLRKYLNGEFLSKLGAVKSAIAETRNSNPNNPWFGKAGGNITADKVFLLSLDEVCRYFGDSTANLRKKGSTGSDCWISDKNNSNRVANYSNAGASWWWLRSPGFSSSDAARVRVGGDVGVLGLSVRNDSGGVRPALWLNL